MVNGERINSIPLDPLDEVLIGSTSFVLHITSNLLIQEEARLMPVAKDQEIEIEEKKGEIVKSSTYLVSLYSRLEQIKKILRYLKRLLITLVKK